jgi:hypothetical protein
MIVMRGDDHTMGCPAVVERVVDRLRHTSMLPYGPTPLLRRDRRTVY